MLADLIFDWKFNIFQDFLRRLMKFSSFPPKPNKYFHSFEYSESIKCKNIQRTPKVRRPHPCSTNTLFFFTELSMLRFSPVKHKMAIKTWNCQKYDKKLYLDEFWFSQTLIWKTKNTKKFPFPASFLSEKLKFTGRSFLLGNLNFNLGAVREWCEALKNFMNFWMLEDFMISLKQRKSFSIQFSIRHEIMHTPGLWTCDSARLA